MPKILTIGSINIDEVFSVSRFVQPGETMSCLSYERFAGGKGNNQSIALARSGSFASHAGRIGQDGSAVVGQLSRCGVDVSRIIIGDEPTGRAVIQVDDSGQNCILLYGGANQRVTESDMDSFLSSFGPGDSVLFQNEVSCLSHGIAKARERGLRIFLNPSPVNAELFLAPLELVDCFILNEIEGRALGDVPLGAESPQAILQALRKRFPKSDIALTLGSMGSLFSGADGSEWAMSATMDIPVDTTAAGDTWTGYFISALLRGFSPKNAMEEASVAAGICITRNGAGPSIPERAEVLERMASHPFSVL